MNELKVLSYDLRKHVVDMIIAGKGGHIGGDMSVMEILVELYMKQMNISPENKDLDNRDRFVLSKGHSVESYYAVLAKKGFFPMEEVISTFSQFGSKFIGHPNNKLPGIEMNSGSLGHGLPVCVGMAMAGKMDRKDYRVYVVMGDGELAEGSVWEGAMAASHYCLDNLCAVVDVNGLQIDGTNDEVMGVGETFGEAYLKAQLGAGERMPATGKIFLSVREEDKPLIVKTAQNFQALGYGVCATRGTAGYLKEHGVVVQAVNKVPEGRPHIVDAIKNGEIALVVNTVASSPQSVADSHSIRRSALNQRVPQYTTVAGGEAMSEGMKSFNLLGVYSVQDLHARLKG